MHFAVVLAGTFRDRSPSAMEHGKVVYSIVTVEEDGLPLKMK